MIDERFLAKIEKYFPLEVNYYRTEYDAINLVDDLNKAEQSFKDKRLKLLGDFRLYFLEALSKEDLLNLHLIVTIVWDQRNYEEWHEKNRQYIKLRNKASQIFINKKARFEPENIDTYLIKKSVYRLFDFLTNEGILNRENSYIFISTFLFESQKVSTTEDAVKKMIQRRDNFH